MLKYFWAVTNILKHSGWQEYATSMQTSVFNLRFQIIVYHPMLDNNCKRCFYSSVKLLYSDSF